MDFYDINILVIVVLACVVFFTWNGYRRGFVKLIISLLSMVLTFYLVWTVTPYISDYLTNETTLYDVTYEKLNDFFHEANSQRDNTVYENQVQTINSYSVPHNMKNMLIDNNNQGMYESLAVNLFEDYVSRFMAKFLIRIMAFIITYLMVMILLKMTFLSMEFISKIPVISGFNRFVGLVAGLTEAMFIVWIAFILMSVFCPKWFYLQVSSSHILSWFYENNLILDIFVRN